MQIFSFIHLIFLDKDLKLSIAEFTSDLSPGSVLSFKPSIPAAIIAAWSKYGLAAPSGNLSSNLPGPGTQTICVLLFDVQVTVFGAQLAPLSVRGALILL